jgi:hypothetical protein
MKSQNVRSCVLAIALLLTASPGWAQETPASPGPATTSAPAKTFTQQDLDQILAPIALYPDALLAQIFMASTYPLEVVEAARWVKANPKMKDKALEDAMQKQTWDPAVKSLTAVPQVLEQMNDKLDWTQKMGDAFLAQQKEVMATVQTLRAKAQAAGNLKSSTQQVVKTEQQGNQTIYIVESSTPDVIYVPTYNPSVVYGVWWYPYPPYYMYPPHYAYPPGVAFTTGVFVGVAIWGGCNWHGGGSVNVNINHYNSFNKTTINNANWNHNVDHRKGVPYQDKGVAQQYNRGANAQATKAREDFRGRADTGRTDLQGMDRSQLQNRPEQADRSQTQNRAQQADRTSGTQRASASQNRAGGNTSMGSGGFSGTGNGASTRAASARGSASRGGGHGRR